MKGALAQLQKQNVEQAAQIGLMYRIEHDLRGNGPALRQAVRTASTGRILARLQKALKLKLTQHRPTSAMGDAIVLGPGVVAATASLP